MLFLAYIFWLTIIDCSPFSLFSFFVNHISLLTIKKYSKIFTYSIILWKAACPKSLEKISNSYQPHKSNPLNSPYTFEPTPSSPTKPPPDKTGTKKVPLTELTSPWTMRWVILIRILTWLTKWRARSLWNGCWVRKRPPRVGRCLLRRKATIRLRKLKASRQLESGCFSNLLWSKNPCLSSEICRMQSRQGFKNSSSDKSKD